MEKKLKEENAAEEEEVKDVPELNDSQFSKLDELLTQTHLYTKFLLEKMDDITVVYLMHCFKSKFRAIDIACLLIKHVML